MINSAFDLIKFQIINSFLTINSNEITIFKAFSFLVIYLFYTNINIFKRKLFEYINKKNSVYLEGKRHFNSGRCLSRYDELYSFRFKAIWYYVNNNINNLDIKSIKEFSALTGQYNDYGEKIDCESNSTFIVNQDSSFKIFKDIYCYVEIYENNYEDTNTNNNCSKKTTENTILLEIYSYKKNIYQINKFIDKIVLDYENYLKNTRSNKLFIYTLDFKNYDYNDKNCYENYV